MRSTLSNWYIQFLVPVKYYIRYLIRSIRKDDHDNNPFIIY